MISPSINELSIKTGRGILWSLTENLGLQVVQFIVSIILARLLLPEQFGLVGMLTLIMIVAQILTIGGFGSAYIQKKDASQLDASSIFFFNIMVGAVLTFLLFVSAPYIARFFKEPLLITLTRVLSFNILINAAALIPTSLLQKRLTFRPFFKVNLMAIIISGIAGVVLALKGFGVWSIVAQSMLNAILRSSLLWKESGWKPLLSFSFSSLASMFPFGSRMLVSGLLDAFFQNLYQPVIGRLFSAADLGYFVRAQTFQTAVTQPTGSALWRVVFPALSEVQSSSLKMKQVTRQIQRAIIFFYFPLIIGLVAVAKPLITLMLTERWSQSIFYFQLFCLSALFYPLEVINQSILLSNGQSNLLLRIEFIKKISIVLSIAITFHWGIYAMLYGQIVTSFLAFCLSSFFSKHIIKYSTLEQLRDVTPSFLISVFMGIIIYLTGNIINSILIRLIFQSLIGVLFYLLMNYIFDRAMLFKFLYFARQLINIPLLSHILNN